MLSMCKIGKNAFSIFTTGQNWTPGASKSNRCHEIKCGTFAAARSDFGGQGPILCPEAWQWRGTEKVFEMKHYQLKQLINN